MTIFCSSSPLVSLYAHDIQLQVVAWLLERGEFYNKSAHKLGSVIGFYVIWEAKRIFKPSMNVIKTCNTVFANGHHLCYISISIFIDGNQQISNLDSL